MKSEELREKFLDFFERNGHTVVPSSSLIPDDPSVLLTTAGMQQFKPYYTGEADPMATIHPTLGKPLGSHNAVSIQKSFRTSDIDEVGDERHLTFFEMMGNFSFGGYFKEEAIKYAFDFLTKEVGLEISYVTIFEGKDGIGVPKDEASRKIWQSLGIADIREEGIEDVFWGPTGSSGPCGPTTEIYCKNGAGEDIEVWNIVFNEFFFAGSREELLLGASGKKLERLKTPGVDTGMGLERLAMCAQKTPTIFETDLFKNLIQLLPVGVHIKHKRVIADHLRASVFLLADDVRPSNKDRGYILRRLIRRCFVYEYMEEIPIQVFETILIETVDQYNFYRVLKERQEVIREEFRNERMRFRKLLPHGLIEINHRIARDKELEKKSSHPIIVKPLSGFQAGLFAFGLFSDSGVPVEVSKELFAEADYDLSRFEEGVQEKARKHQELSRAGAGAKFGGHGLYMKTGEVTIRDESEVERVTRLHTATHLLHAALRAVLGPEVRQDGSDITVERTRFDFKFGRKLTPEEIKKVEDWVNDAVRRDLKVQWEEMAYEEGVKKGALGFFREKYPPRVKIYTMYDAAGDEVVSCEFCGGPHVTHTAEVGKFKIIKEEASSAGVRRIRGVVE